MAESKTRYYIVFAKTEDGKEGDPVALIDAQNVQQSAKHFVDKNFVTRFAEQDDVFAAACKGLKPEKAKASAEGT